MSTEQSNQKEQSNQNKNYNNNDNGNGSLNEKQPDTVLNNDTLNTKQQSLVKDVIEIKKPKLPISIAHTTFLQGFLGVLKSTFTDSGVLLMIVLAPIIYGFFYPWPYQGEVVENIPVGIIDYDHSQLSQTLSKYSQASPRLNVATYNSQADANYAMYKGDIAGYMVIPSNLETNVYANKPTHVSVFGNNGYFLLNKYVLTGFSQAVGTVSAGVEVKRAVAKGAYLETAKISTQAIPLRIDPEFNRSEGYGAYIVPAVAILILQQTLLMGTALLIGSWYERKRHHATISGWAGRITSLALINFAIGCFYYGWVFSIQDYPRGHNLTDTLLFYALFAPTVATLGCLLGMWFKERERSLQILIFSSLPIFFVSGYPWPVEQLPLPLQYIRWIFPSTAGMNASVQLNQMGASLSQVSGYLYALTGLWIFAFILLIYVQYRLVKKSKHSTALN